MNIHNLKIGETFVGDRTEFYKVDSNDVVRQKAIEAHGMARFEAMSVGTMESQIALIPMDNAQHKANAALIAEVFNVANKTGKSPNDLMEENKRLLLVLREAEQMINPANITMATHRKMIHENILKTLNTE